MPGKGVVLCGSSYLILEKKYHGVQQVKFIANTSDIVQPKEMKFRFEEIKLPNMAR